jgi:hypothetical protein
MAPWRPIPGPRLAISWPGGTSWWRPAGTGRWARRPLPAWPDSPKWRRRWSCPWPRAGRTACSGCWSTSAEGGHLVVDRVRCWIRPPFSRRPGGRCFAGWRRWARRSRPRRRRIQRATPRPTWPASAAGWDREAPAPSCLPPTTSPSSSCPLTPSGMRRRPRPSGWNASSSGGRRRAREKGFRRRSPSSAAGTPISWIRPWPAADFPPWSARAPRRGGTRSSFSPWSWPTSGARWT